MKKTLVKQKDSKKTSTKDVLLHQIFEEINNENKEINPHGYLDEIIPEPQAKLSKIRNIQKKRNWFFILIILLSIVYILFNSNTPSDKKEAPSIDSKTNHISYQKEEHLILKNIKEEVAYKKPLPISYPIETPPKKPTLRKKIHIEVTDPQDIQILPKNIEFNMRSENLKKPKSEREKAKAALLMQMQDH